MNRRRPNCSLLWPRTLTLIFPATCKFYSAPRPWFTYPFNAQLRNFERSVALVPAATVLNHLFSKPMCVHCRVVLATDSKNSRPRHNTELYRRSQILFHIQRHSNVTVTYCTRWPRREIKLQKRFCDTASTFPDQNDDQIHYFQRKLFVATRFLSQLDYFCVSSFTSYKFYLLTSKLAFLQSIKKGFPYFGLFIIIAYGTS